VVVDDAFQEVTRVVRGADLLSSTAWQLDLQSALGMPRPIYGHLPLVVEADGAKLSKSRHAVAVDPSQVAIGLTTTLTLLSHAPPPELARDSAKNVWDWAFQHWNPQALAGRSHVPCSPAATAKQKLR
jgi:glutamyl-Q tRNA(Asp) synthetase